MCSTIRHFEWTYPATEVIQHKELCALTTTKIQSVNKYAMLCYTTYVTMLRAGTIIFHPLSP